MTLRSEHCEGVSSWRRFAAILPIALLMLPIGCKDDSDDCETCENCEECENCEQCEECESCEQCENCEECENCEQCEECENCEQCDTCDDTRTAKYVFYLIGDGMGLQQINAAEYYLSARDNSGAVGPSYDVAPVTPPALLNMSTLPAQGFQTTYSNNSYITDSAASGTALACGFKTDSGVISMSPDLATEYESIAAQAKAAGMRVGIISSVSIDHATPAVFYAHNESRNDYFGIGMDLTTSNFDYFAGGGFRTNKYGTDGTWDDIQSSATDNNYTIVESRASFEALDADSGKVIAMNAERDSSDAIPFDLVRDRSDDNDDISLKEFVEKGIQLLDNDDGFFMMVESGKIDWAGHANDAASNIKDTVHFDEVVGVALEFYEAHPDETLIVVTADHECGGMTLGFAGTGYDSMFQLIDEQTVSYDVFPAMVAEELDGINDPTLADLDGLIEDSFGLDMDEDGTGVALTELERAQLEQAFLDMNAEAPTAGTPEADQWYLDYGGYDALTITLTHILNQKAGIGWTSYSHTGVQVPVFAKGAQEDSFNGYYDNTDIYTKIHAAMGL